MECVVAILLLSAASIVALSLARTTTLSRQSAQSTALAWAYASVVVDGETGTACNAPSAAGTFTNPHIAITWTDALLGAAHRRDVSLTTSRSALAGAPLHPFAFSSVRYCP